MTDHVGANFDVGEALGPECVIVTCLADGAITKGDFVKLSDDTDFGVVACDTQGESAFGVAMKAAAAAGVHIPVCVFGRVKMDTGGNITAGAQVTTGTGGLPEAAIAADMVNGVALQSATSGDEIIVFVGVSRPIY